MTTDYYIPASLLERLQVGVRVRFRYGERPDQFCPHCGADITLREMYEALSGGVYEIVFIAKEYHMPTCPYCGERFLRPSAGYPYLLFHPAETNGHFYCGFPATWSELSPLGDSE